MWRVVHKRIADIGVVAILVGLCGWVDMEDGEVE